MNRINNHTRLAIAGAIVLALATRSHGAIRTILDIAGAALLIYAATRMAQNLPQVKESLPFLSEKRSYLPTPIELGIEMSERHLRDKQFFTALEGSTECLKQNQ